VCVPVYLLTDCAVCKQGYISARGFRCDKCSSDAGKVTLGVVIIACAVIAAVCCHVVRDLLMLNDYNRKPAKGVLAKLRYNIGRVCWSKLRIVLVVLQILASV
jgi:hypothetical protein